MTQSDFTLIDDTLARAADILGDITPLVYARLFAAAPGIEALFDRDTTGAARAAMLSLAIEMIQDLAGPNVFATHFIAAERAQHEELGVDPAQFIVFFEIVRDTLRDGLGAHWTAETDAAWARSLARVKAATTNACSV